MKYIKNGEASALITTNDITTSNQRSLSEVLNEQQQDINSLKSNVKWIYKYGGVGSGGTGGGNSQEESVPWKCVVSLDGVVYQKSGETAFFGDSGTYNLSLTFFKVQGRTFYVKISYKSRNQTQIINKTVTPTGNNELISQLYLDSNDVISIVISDDEGFVYTFNINYITKSYEFQAQYVYSDTKEPYLLEDYNMYISAVKDRAVELEIRATIVVPFEEVSIEYINWNGESKILSNVNGDIVSGNNVFYESLGIPLNGDNAGYYKAVIKPQIKLQNALEYEDLEEIELVCNLIPDFCYLKVQAEATLYSQNDQQEPVYSNTGLIVLNVTPYQDFVDKTKLFNLTTTVSCTPFTEGGEVIQYNTINKQLTDRVPYPLQIAVPDEGCYTITFDLERNGEHYPKTYYVYVRIPNSQYTWFPENDNIGYNKIKPLLSNQYLFNKQTHQCDSEEVFSIYDKSTLIQKTMQDKEDLVIPLNRYNGDATVDTLINIAINYNNINEVTNPILTFKDLGTTKASMSIFQNQITYNSLQESNIYIPKNSYHLITIYKRAVKKINNLTTYETCVYIDGVLEPSFKTMQQTGSVKWDELTCHIGNYSIEYLEVSYFNHSENNGSYFYEPNRTYFNDTDVVFHYYSYCDLFEKFEENYLNTFKDVYNIAKGMEIDHENSRIKTTLDTILQLAEKQEIPVLLLEYLDSTKGNSPENAGKIFMSWMENRYNVQGSGNYTEKPKVLNQIQYSPGKQPLATISTDVNKYYFELDLQGTSTMLYGAKNYDLILTTNQSYIDESEENKNKKFLYSFNFKENDSSTFLPESRFTLKADVVDSSHSNNATIGKFVNSVTTPFSDANIKQGNSRYASYIKNTLEGFPILLFIKNSYFIGQDSETTADYYYMGIYSFNLGRDSEYNLGYKDLKIFEKADGSSLLSENKYIVEVEDSGLYLPGFGVAEIQENQPYFDFSQYHDSILFGEGESTSFAMFSKYKSSNTTDLRRWIKNMVSSVSSAGGYIFETVLGKNLLDSNDIPDISYKTGYKYKIPLNLVGNYKTQLKLTTSGTDLTFSTFEKKDSASMGAVQDTLIANPEQDIINSVDYTSLSEYYVICMALGLVDSVQKNMNIKTWNGNTFYTAFYDMDTSLGKDNAGNDTDPVAFSDFWKAEQANEYGEVVLKQATQYRDWYDPDIHGYDIPSHYLFALAKYAPMVIDSEQIYRYCPNNIWARFRRSDASPINDNGYTNFITNSLGCLRNSDYFIETYYGNYLSKVADLLFNFNYRKKYLTIQTSTNGEISYNSDNAKFGGKRINYVRDWLNSRFHLLDLYFGINPDAIDVVKKCNITEYDENGYPLKGEWVDFINTSGNAKTYPTTASQYVDGENQDVLILQNAFSPTLATKYSSNIRVLFQSEEYSPIVFSGAQLGRYIVGDSLIKYKLDIDSAGKSVGFGGSKNWTYVSNINPFIIGKNFYLDNEKMTSLEGLGITEYNIEPQECQTWNIHAPSLKTINLNSSKYSGQLTINGISGSWVNIKNVDISNSKMSLTVQDVPILGIKVDSVINTAAQLIVANCSSLESISYNGAELDTMIFTVPFNNNPNSKYVSLNKSKVYNGTTFVNGTNNNHAIATNIQITCSTGDGEISISDQNFSSESGGLTSLTLKGFKKIYINNCWYLSSVDISDGDNVEELEIKSCSKYADNLFINSKDCVDLSKFTNLKSIDFGYTVGFEKLILPNNPVLLKPLCFYQSSIKYLDGKASFGINNNDTFKYSNFTLKDSRGNFSDFTFPEQNGLTFNGTFNQLKTKITHKTFYDFNVKYRDGIAKIRDAGYMWHMSIVPYNLDSLKEDKTGLLSVGWYTGVDTSKGETNSVLGNEGILAATHKNQFEITYNNKDYTFGGNSSDVALHDGFIGSVIHKDCMVPISSRITSVYLAYVINTHTIVDDNGNEVTNIYAYNIFGGNPSKLKHINYLPIKNTITVDFTNFSSKFPALEEVDGAFYGCKASNIIDSNGYGFLYDLTTKRNFICRSSFSFYQNETVVDYTKFINWNNCKNLFIATGSDISYSNLSVNKIIHGISAFEECMQKVIDNCGSQAYMVFANCTVRLNENDLEEMPSFESKNTNITHFYRAFYNFKFQDYEGNEIDVPFNWDLMESFPNAQIFEQTFYNVKFKGCLPFNAFRRRNESTSRKTITIQGTTQTFVLHTFAYSNKITNLKSCFQNCRFTIPYFEHETAWQNVLSNYIEYNNKQYFNFNDLLEDLKQLDSDFDYSKHFTGTWLITKENLELQGKDILDYVDYYEGELEGVQNGATGVIKHISNYFQTSTGYEFNSVEGTQTVKKFKHYIIPPDIFYGCSNAAHISSVFNNCQLIGAIPDNLFLGNCKTPQTTDYFLSGNYIFPKKYKDVYEPLSEEATNKFNIYYYIPSGFINSTNLTNMFAGCKMCLPYSSITKDEYGYIDRDMYVFCFTDSMPKVTNMPGFLPTTINTTFDKNIPIAESNKFVLTSGGINGIVYTSAQEDKTINRITINSMYDKQSEMLVVINNNVFTEVKKEEDNYYAYLLIDDNNQYTDLYGNIQTLTKEEDTWFLEGSPVNVVSDKNSNKLKLLIEDQSSIKTKIGKLGWYLSSKGARYSQVLASIWLQFGYGNLVQTGLSLNSLTLEGWFINTKTLGISSDLVFPSMYSARTKIIENTPRAAEGPYSVIKATQIENSNTAAVNAYNNSVIFNLTTTTNDTFVQ